MRSSLFLLAFLVTISCSQDDEMDTTPPTISLIGEEEVTITLGTSYIDSGVSAFDDIDGDLDSSVIIANPVDVNVLGTYIINYSVSDSNGNETAIIRTVHVEPASYLTTTVPFGRYIDLETNDVCWGADDCDFLSIDPTYDFAFDAMEDGSDGLAMWWNPNNSSMAKVYDKSFDELSLFFVSNYYFCQGTIGADTSCDDSGERNYVGLFKTSESNVFAVEYLELDEISVGNGESVEASRFKYKLLN